MTDQIRRQMLRALGWAGAASALGVYGASSLAADGSGASPEGFVELGNFALENAAIADL